MAYTPQQVANYFLTAADADGVSMTQLKLIKLVYIAYGWFLALKGERLFLEPIEAWKHGPVIPSIYHEFKDFGSQPITRRAVDLDLDTWESIVPAIPASDQETTLILDRVWSAYRKFSGWQLRNMTHQVDSPWSKVYIDELKGVTLRDSDISEHYKQRIKNYLVTAGNHRAA